MTDNSVVSESDDSHLMPFQRLDIYRCSKELVVIVHRAAVRDEELKDQIRRASKSVFLHVAEGLPNYSMPMRRKYFIGARNSVCETSAAADGALAIGCLDEDTAIDIMRRCQSIAKMLSALMR
jgi:four helix bundle protein